MLIGQLAVEAQVPASAIRYYEKCGVLPRPVRVSGQRRYGPDAKDRLAVLKLAQACGFTLAEVKTLLLGFDQRSGPSERWRKLAARKARELDAQIMNLQKMRKLVDQVADCKCVNLQECGRRAVSATRQNG